MTIQNQQWLLWLARRFHPKAKEAWFRCSSYPLEGSITYITPGLSFRRWRKSTLASIPGHCITHSAAIIVEFWHRYYTVSFGVVIEDASKEVE